MINFGLGSLFSIPSGSNPTPLAFATLKGITVDVGGENDPLRGEKFWNEALAKKGGKCAGKIDVARLDPKVISQVIPGVTRTTGTQKGIRDESGTIPTTPFQITVAQAATFQQDLGVFDTVTGLYMTRGATATGTGVYAVSAGGVYTFHTSDSGHAVKISYRYSVAGSGSTYTFDNQVMTEATYLSLEVYGTNVRMVFPKVAIPKLSFGLKAEGWTEYGLEWEAAYDTTTSSIAKIYFDE